MEMTVRNGCVTLLGRLDEADTKAKVVGALETARAQLSDPAAPVRVDFSGISFANSLGIREWCLCLEAFPHPITYVRAPCWLIEQMNIVQELLREDMDVESFFAPFFSEATDTTELKVLEVGTDVPLLDDYTDFEVPAKFLEGGFTPDFDADSYFVFLTDLKRYRGA